MPSSDLGLQKMPIYTRTRIVTHSIKCESKANREYRTPEIALERSVHSITWENTSPHSNSNEKEDLYENQLRLMSLSFLPENIVIYLFVNFIYLTGPKNVLSQGLYHPCSEQWALSNSDIFFFHLLKLFQGMH